MFLFLLRHRSAMFFRCFWDFGCFGCFCLRFKNCRNEGSFCFEDFWVIFFGKVFFQEEPEELSKETCCFVLCFMFGRIFLGLSPKEHGFWFYWWTF